MNTKLRHIGIGLLVTSAWLAVEGASFGEKPALAPIRDPEHTFSKRVTSWKALSRRNIVMQQRDYSCGAAALATVARYYWGDNVGEEFFLRELDHLLTVEEMKDRVENGLAMSDLRRVAVKTGYQAVVGKLTFDKLIEAKVPLVVGITPNDYDHFVVYRGFDGYYVYLADPIRGNIRIPAKKFLDQWQENAALVIHKPGSKVKEVSALTVSGKEMSLGELNYQFIRTLPSRQPPQTPIPLP